MSDYKFKVGDRVKHPQKGVGTVLYITPTGSIGVEYDNWHGGHDLFAYPESQCKVTKKDSCYFEQPAHIELITDYQPITPKVGEKYRVLKSGIHFKEGQIVEIDRKDDYGQWRGKGTACINGGINYLTTEYLELVEEPQCYSKGVTEMTQAATGWQEQANQMMQWGGYPIFQTRAEDFKPFDHDALMKRLIEHAAHNYIKKQSVITKTMNFIKKLTQSAEDKTLEKADFVNSYGDLTSIGKEALLSLVFQEKKKDLVTLAEQVIEENKD